MHIMNPDNSTQSLTLLTRTRGTNTVQVEITDETTRVAATQTVTGTTTTKGRFSLVVNFTPVEDHYYQITITESGDVLYMGKAYATTQTELDKFTLYQGAHTSQEGSNTTFVYPQQ